MRPAMESVENKTKMLYEKRWQNAIAKGDERAGNLDLNLVFLEQSGLLTSDKKILELGCGVGLLTNALHQKGLDIIGSDVSQNVIDYAHSKYPDLSFSAFSADQLPYPNSSFDILLSFDVLEHLHDVDSHLTEVHRILKPNGHYLLQTPNKLTNVIFETLKDHSLYWRTYHPSLHFYGQLRRRLRQHGLEPQFVKMNTMNPHTLTKLGKLGLPQFLFQWIDFRRLPYRLQTNFYIIAQKKTETPTL